MHELQQQLASDIKILPRRLPSVAGWRTRFLHAATAGLAFLFVAGLVLGLIA
ncbi:hypothetical protein [Rhizobium sp. FY34]|uniref:hypothetical protein n=1 Tax=Rhizobium sp. FY34 TaxID=2562309 RepID=UPI0014858D53|nr:hypothetical protein [Rhizobium sp. FY34]